ncbi:MAG: coproporphyrinogen III oxidase family protein [Desulfuromonadales bacterium]|nr:coproporphyrinogen III oxidase family protein [Desulfuromonadales bacterium]
MERNLVLSKIRNELFYGSSSYTKNQPDLFIPHQFQMLAPSQARSFLETVIESIPEREILLYVHLPFCFSECLFCNSFPQKVDKNIQQNYLSYLLKEIELYAKSGIFDGKKAQCIYFGGGTPTSYSNSDLKRIIDTIKSSIELSETCNITSEAHPQTLENKKRIFDLADFGINRLSIGCQTFDPNVLSLCNRSNTPSQIHSIVNSAHDAGLSINIDMMTGLPGQTIDKVQKDLALLEEIRPDSIEYIRHEIVNPLVAELYKSRPELMIDDDTLFEMIFMTQEWMEKNGYEQNGRFSNDKQWAYRYHWLKEMPIIAFGTRTRSTSKTICYDKHEELSNYTRLLDKGLPPIGRYIILSKRERMYRSLILGLQIKSGLNFKQFYDSFGESSLDVFGPLFDKLIEFGCLTTDAESIRLSRYGAFFVEDVCDLIIDTALREKSKGLERTPHSGGNRYSNLALGE